MTRRDSALAPIHERLGASFGELAGRRVPRHYGDPAAEYATATTGAGVVDRSERTLIRLHGRDPVKIIQGLISNDLASAPEGRGVYATVLTPKGKIVTDVRAFRWPAGEVLLDAEGGARVPLLAHLGKFVPPLFARFEDASERLGVLGVFGPEARERIAAVLGADLPPDLPESAAVGAERGGQAVLVVRTFYAGVDGYDVVLPTSLVEETWHALTEAGARPVGHGTLEVLRIEAGRPRWGAELDDTVIPLEAELRGRAISESKGCYTGQEVIVRVLHRGHVNRHLRALRLGDVPAPAPGTELFRAGDGRAIGKVTSACASPRFDETIGLGYVRREIEPPARLRLGAPDGPEIGVEPLPSS